MNFNQYIGQKEIKKALRNMLKSNRLSHAYSFEAPGGMGKLALAKIFAGAILCDNESDDLCGICSSCKKFLSGNHPDFSIISSDKPSIGVEEIRNMQQNIIVKPIASQRKVYIIDHAEKMTVQAQNCLLKTLEEPSGPAVLILCVENANVMLKTIQSRCLRLKFESYNTDEIKDILSANSQVDAELIEFAAKFSQGVLGKAFSAVSHDFMHLREDVIRCLTVGLSCAIQELLGVSAFFEDNKNMIDDIFDLITIWYRDLAVYKTTKDDKLLINFDKKDIIIKKVAEYTDAEIIKLIEIVEEARKDIKRNVSFQMVLDNMLISFWEVVNGKGCRSAV